MKETYLKTRSLFLEIRPAPTAKELFFLVPCWRSSRCSVDIVQSVKGRWDGRIKFTKRIKMMENICCFDSATIYMTDSVPTSRKTLNKKTVSNS